MDPDRAEMRRFSDPALKVLDVLSSEAVDGYELMRRTGLCEDG